MLAKAIRGDEAALGALWRAWNPVLLRFFRSRRVLEPDDLAQRVWLEVAGKIGQFEGGPDSFRRWLFTLSYRRMIDAARAEKRRPSPGPLKGSMHVPVVRFEDEVDGLSWALSLLAELPEKQATAVSLRILAGMTVQEVAEVMSEREPTVRVLTHRGLRRLRRLLGAAEEKPSEAVTERKASSLTSIT